MKCLMRVKEDEKKLNESQEKFDGKVVRKV